MSERARGVFEICHDSSRKDPPVLILFCPPPVFVDSVLRIPALRLKPGADIGAVSDAMLSGAPLCFSPPPPPPRRPAAGLRFVPGSSPTCFSPCQSQCTGAT